MLKTMTFVSAFLFLLIVAGANAGINPNVPGLPNATAWGRTGIANNGASGMCVDCHTANPSNRALRWYGNANGARTGSRSLTGMQTTDSAGTHWVNPTGTNTGGGYAGNKAGAVRTTGEYEKITLWTAWNGGTPPNTTTSKYATADNVSTGGFQASDNTDRAPTRGGMICESCHNIIKNAQSGGETIDATNFPGNRKLLKWATNNGSGDLCAGCHGNMDRMINNDEGNYFANQTTGRDHHRNTQGPNTGSGNNAYGGTIAAFGENMAQIDKTWYDNNVTLQGKMWAVSSGLLTGLPRALSFNPANNAGILATPLTTGDITLFNNVNTLTCSQCHRAHMANTAGGSLIVKTGTGAPVIGTGDTNFPSWGSAGLVRQSDKGNPATFSTKMLQANGKLCAGCHTGYAQ